MPGRIEKLPCEPYDYVVKETGEMLTLDHTWNYNPNPTSIEEHVMGDSLQYA